ncbi:MAG: hypothetical protein Q9211_004155 [Gyalolechia sp. 1 TL-2023]
MASSLTMEIGNSFRAEEAAYEHPIVGIGRTSTQTTLASVETDVAGQESQQREGGAETDEEDTQVISHPTQFRPLRVDTSVNSAHLSPIAEGISPARQSSTALVSPRSVGPASERSVPHHWTESSQNGRDQAHDTTEHGAAQPKHLTAGNGPSSSGRSFRNKLRMHFQKPRHFTIHRLGLHIQVSPTPLAPAPSPLFAAHAGQRAEHAEDIDHPPTSGRHTALDTPTICSDSPSVTRGDVEITQTAETIPQPEPAYPDLPMEGTRTHHDKHERIRVQRREATLQRKAEMIARCECQAECQCRNGSLGSNAASYGPESSERSIQIPDHYLHNILSESTESSTGQSPSSMVRALDLTGIGSHVHSEHGGRSRDDPTNLEVGNQQFFDDRLSQTSTAYVRSNGSSISLVSRATSSRMRSNIAPGVPSRRPTDGLEVRPQVAEVLQNRNIPDHGHGSASHVADSSESSDSDVGETSNAAQPEPDSIP